MSGSDEIFVIKGLGILNLGHMLAGPNSMEFLGKVCLHAADHLH